MVTFILVILAIFLPLLDLGLKVSDDLPLFFSLCTIHDVSVVLFLIDRTKVVVLLYVRVAFLLGIFEIMSDLVDVFSDVLPFFTRWW